jgi:hypothetical protein
MKLTMLINPVYEKHKSFQIKKIFLYLFIFTFLKVLFYSVIVRNYYLDSHSTNKERGQIFEFSIMIKNLI